jgi:hypothetical protein
LARNGTDSVIVADSKWWVMLRVRGVRKSGSKNRELPMSVSLWIVS